MEGIGSSWQVIGKLQVRSYCTLLSATGLNVRNNAWHDSCPFVLISGVGGGLRRL